MQESTITSKGQTTIPKKVREALALKPGDRLRYVIRGGDVSLAKGRKVSTLSGILKRKGPPVSLEKMEQAIGDARDARMDQLKNDRT